jgi:hypothetical protein
MESLKPLKIIGALALLCLTIYLAIPDGRLNAQQMVYSLSQPNINGIGDPNLFAQRFQPKVHEDRKFLLAWQRYATTSKSMNSGEGIKEIQDMADAAIESNDVVKLAIVAKDLSGGVGAIPNQQFKPSEKLTANNKWFAEQLKKLCQTGRRLEPKNAFWPFIEASCERVLDNPDQLRKDLVDASNCTHYNEHLFDQTRLRTKNSNAPESAFNVTIIQSTIMLPHLSTHNVLIRYFIGETYPQKNISDRIAAMKIGKLMCESDEAYITQLVGRSIISKAASLNNPTGGDPKRIYSFLELEQIARLQNIQTHGLFEGALAVSSTRLDFPNSDSIQKVFNQGPLLTFLPFIVFIFFVSSIAIYLLTTKLCAKPIVKPIRYLFVLPISTFFAFERNIDGSFHSQVIILIALFSLPIAYFTFTEKFVPVVHLTVAAIAFFAFLPSSSIPRLAFELAFVSALALLAWWQNRKPDHKLSGVTPFLFAIIGATIFAQWIIRSFAQDSYFNFQLGMVFNFISYIFATTHPDKMEARKQANTIATFGIAYLFLGCITSIITSNYFWNRALDERIRTKNFSSAAIQIFKQAEDRANNSPTPDVKLKST